MDYSKFYKIDSALKEQLQSRGMTKQLADLKDLPNKIKERKRISFNAAPQIFSDLGEDAKAIRATIFAETSGNEDETKAIINVIQNRVNTPGRFGENPYSVVTAPNQFAGYNSEQYKKVIKGSNNPLDQKRLLQIDKLYHYSKMGKIKDNTGGATHFSKGIPEWAGLNTVKKIGQHYFYKERPSSE